MSKVAILIPTTSNNRNEWSTIKDSYLYKSMKSFLHSLTCDDKYIYTFYIGYDDNDRIFSDKKQQTFIKRFKKVFTNLNIEWISMSGIPKGHLTKMWNRLFRFAYNADNAFFYQCGDDIEYCTKGWVDATIQVLQEHGGIGISGPINNNNRILTQAMVTRKHMEIFGFFFPETIINWCCDDWYNWVYQPHHFYPIREHYCANIGGQPRYVIDNNPEFHETRSLLMTRTKELREKTWTLAKEHATQVTQYIQHQEHTSNVLEF